MLMSVHAHSPAWVHLDSTHAIESLHLIEIQANPIVSGEAPPPWALALPMSFQQTAPQTQRRRVKAGSEGESAHF
ncbi:MAG TPA: hypothetical protein VFV39_01430 [Limnobacter sp.]|nr:hypothetical protein [Limnobacter sp.]